MQIVGERSQEIKDENHAINHIENRYMTDNRKIPLNEHLEHEATPEKIEAVKEMWKNGISITDMARYFNNDSEGNIFMILLHLEYKGRIRRRTGGLYS